MKVLPVLACALVCGLAVPCRAEPTRLGLELLAKDRSAPELVLAQRSIEREWATLSDSAVIAQRREGNLSELGALGLSAAFPGAGQLYSRRPSAIYYAAAEVAGWVGWVLLKDGARLLRHDAERIAGQPEDSSSSWSFERWEAATAGDATMLRALYAGDREAFYDAIGSSDYSQGWSDAERQQRFTEQRRRSDRRLVRARWTTAVLWVNHLVSAVDALRAARMRNLDWELAGDVEFKARGRWQDGRPGVTLLLQRRF